MLLTRTRRLALAAVIPLALVGACLSIRPSNDRAWSPDQAVLPYAEIDGHVARVHNIRNNRYESPHRYAVRYYDRTFDLDSLESAWFVVEPFSGVPGPAHTFVSFGFADSQFVAVSVEARREPPEHYAVLTGLFKRFELIYVIGDERDLIGSRAVHGGGYDVYVYPVRASREKIRALFVDMMRRADALREAPEFYNTVTNNCTSNVVAHVNRITPRKVPTGPKTVFPGYADEVAHSLGLIDQAIPIAEARRRYRVNERARRFADDPDFSLRIREVDDAASSSAQAP